MGKVALIRVAFYPSSIPLKCLTMFDSFNLKHEKIANDPLLVPDPGSRRIFGYFHGVPVLLLNKEAIHM